MHSLKGDIKKVERLEEIVGILFKEELGYILDKLNIAHILPVHKRLRAKRHPKPKPERLRETFEQLGTVFIKFGQILSERPDLVPEKYAEELSKLQDSVPAFDTDKAKEIVDEEVGLDNLESFEEEPLAAASIAQIHRAKLKSGEEIVLKIRRPEIKEKVERDISILIFLAKRADKVVDMGGEFVQTEVREFGSWTREELNFRNERNNMKAFKKNMEDEERIRVPEVYDEYCSEKVLAIEYIDAVKCDNIEEIHKMNLDGEEIAKTGLRSVIKQVIRDGLIHADPHPSNFMVDRDGNMVFLDFGMMTRITSKMQRELGMMIMQISNGNIDGLMKTIEKISYVDDDADRDILRDKIEKEVLKLRGASIQDQSASRIMIKIATYSAQYGIYLPTKVTLIGKGLLTIEGIGMKIYPDFQLQNEFEDEIEEAIIKSNKPQDMAKDFAFNLIQNQEVITKLPEKINNKLNSEQKTPTVNVQSNKTKIFPAVLIASSTALIALSLEYRPLLYIGAAELALGILIHMRENPE